MKKTPTWVEKELALVIHNLQLVEHGGTEGIREMNLLESALDRPKNLFAYSAKLPSLGRLAAVYAFGIASNHPFVDGNKRTALAVAGTFLGLNGMELTASQEDTYLMFWHLAAGEITEKELAIWFEQHVVSAS